MEVLIESDSPVLLTNSEVLEMLGRNIDRRKESEENSKKKRRKSSKFAHRDWIEEHVHRYLQSTPCVNLSDIAKLPEIKSKLMASKSQQPNMGGLKKTTGFGLTEAESIMIVNFLPIEPVEIHLMVEEMHGRCSEHQQSELLEMIASYRKEDTLRNADRPPVEDVTDDGRPSGEVGEVHSGHLPRISIKAEL